MIDYTFEIDKTTLPERLSFVVPENLQGLLCVFIKNADKDYFRIRMTKPRKPRTRSQQGLFHSIIQQISVETGNSFDVVKMHIKTEAISEGYPYEQIKGKIYPKSEALASTTEEKVLIDCAVRLAAEYNVRLREYDD